MKQYLTEVSLTRALRRHHGPFSLPSLTHTSVARSKEEAQALLLLPHADLVHARLPAAPVLQRTAENVGMAFAPLFPSFLSTPALTSCICHCNGAILSGPLLRPSLCLSQLSYLPILHMAFGRMRPLSLYFTLYLSFRGPPL